VREYYKKNFPLNHAAMNDPFLNPGLGSVSKLCFEPRVGAVVLNEMLNDKLVIMLNTKAVKVETELDTVRFPPSLYHFSKKIGVKTLYQYKHLIA
jgi:hypothetical protein